MTVTFIFNINQWEAWTSWNIICVSVPAQEATIGHGSNLIGDVQGLQTSAASGQRDFQLHLPVHVNTQRTRGEFLESLLELRQTKGYSLDDLENLCYVLEQMHPEAGRFSLPVLEALRHCYQERGWQVWTAKPAPPACRCAGTELPSRWLPVVPVQSSLWFSSFQHFR